MNLPVSNRRKSAAADCFFVKGDEGGHQPPAAVNPVIAAKPGLKGSDLLLAQVFVL